MRKGRDGGKRGKKTGGKKKEKTDENSGHYVIASSWLPKLRPLERHTLAPKNYVVLGSAWTEFDHHILNLPIPTTQQYVQFSLPHVRHGYSNHIDFYKSIPMVMVIYIWFLNGHIGLDQMSQNVQPNFF